MTWDGERLGGLLDSARRAQSELLGTVKALDLEAVRASMMLRLGVEAKLAKVAGGTSRVDPIVDILAQALRGWESALTSGRISGWHRALFPMGVQDGAQTFPAGELRGDYPRIVATLGHRPDDPETIHFEAPRGPRPAW